VNQRWLFDPALGGGTIGQLSDEERNFFEELIKKYLFPLETDRPREERVAAQLLALRNKTCLGFLFVNAVLVLVMFTLQLHAARLAVPWPWGRKGLSLNPLGVFFLAFFVVIMLVQTLAMLRHRVGTLMHLVSATSLDCCRGTGRLGVGSRAENAIELAKDLGRLQVSWLFFSR